MRSHIARSACRELHLLLIKHDSFHLESRACLPLYYKHSRSTFASHSLSQAQTVCKTADLPEEMPSDLVPEDKALHPSLSA